MTVNLYRQIFPNMVLCGSLPCSKKYEKRVAIFCHFLNVLLFHGQTIVTLQVQYYIFGMLPKSMSEHVGWGEPML